MIAVLEFIDGFGADTNVVGIYKSLEDAVYFHGDNFEYKTFEFGKVIRISCDIGTKIN